MMQTVINPELARQRARIAAVRARIHAGAVPDPGIDLRRRAVPENALVRDVTAFVPDRDRVQHDAHVRLFQRALRSRSPYGPRVADVVEVVAAVWRVPVPEILGASRVPRFVRPRHAAVYLCRTLSPRSWAEISRAFDRDHASSINGFRVVENAVAAGDAELVERLAECRRRLGLDAESRFV